MSRIRIDVNGPYAPGNCRWATSAMQGANRRNTRLLEHDGKALTAGGWGRLVGLPSHVIVGRVRMGWPMARILSEPVQPQHRYKGKNC